MEEDFSSLLARLRIERGLSQSRLAELAGVSLATVQRGESKGSKVPTRRIAARLLDGLNKAGSVAETDARRFVALTGVPVPRPASPAYTGANLSARAREAVLAAATKPAAILKAIRDYAPEYEQPFLVLATLVDELGEQRTLDILRGVLVASRGSATTEGEIGELHVKHPPREVNLGGVRAKEEQIVTYGRPATGRGGKGRGGSRGGKAS